MSFFFLSLCLICVISSSLAIGGGFHHLELTDELPEQPVQNQPEDTTDIRFLYQCIDEHNEQRKSQSINNIINFNRELTDLASRRANKLVTTRKFSNSKLLPEIGIAENAALINANEPLVNCRKVVKAWSSVSQHSKKQVKSHDNMRLKTSPQRDLVWETSRQVGCSRVILKDVVAVVCLYRKANSQ